MLAKGTSRRHLFVDPQIQGRLILRVVLYWMLCLIGVGLMLLAWRLCVGPAKLLHDHLRDLWHDYLPALVASLLLLPLVIADVLRVSNRFVGPLLRLRRAMRQIARGELIQPLHFRRDDLCQEMAEEFNAVLERLPKPTSAVNLTTWKPTNTTDGPDNTAACG